MAITRQHEKGEPTEADLAHAYEKARGIGLFLVEKYAREVLRRKPQYDEFMIDDDGSWGFNENDTMHCWVHEEPLYTFIQDWDDLLGITNQQMRFTAIGPVRRRWWKATVHLWRTLLPGSNKLLTKCGKTITERTNVLWASTAKDLGILPSAMCKTCYRNGPPWLAAVK